MASWTPNKLILQLDHFTNLRNLPYLGPPSDKGSLPSARVLACGLEPVVFSFIHFMGHFF